MATGSIAMLVVALVVAICAYLAVNGWSTFSRAGLSFFDSAHWSPPTHLGIAGALVGTVVIAVVALCVALPLSLALALAVHLYAPGPVRRWLAMAVEISAAVPSVVFGYWGAFVLTNYVVHTSRWLDVHATFIPVFRTAEPGAYRSSVFLCGLVVGVMIIPVVTSVTSRCMAQVPASATDGALALGATRWSMVANALLPGARRGIIGGALLGLGRAVGETVAVLVILSTDNVLSARILGPGGLGSVTKLIGEGTVGSSPAQRSALALAGLVVFLCALGANIGGRAVAARRGGTAWA